MGINFVFSDINETPLFDEALILTLKKIIAYAGDIGEIPVHLKCKHCPYIEKSSEIRRIITICTFPEILPLGNFREFPSLTILVSWEQEN